MARKQEKDRDWRGTRQLDFTCVANKKEHLPRKEDTLLKLMRELFYSRIKNKSYQNSHKKVKISKL